MNNYVSPYGFGPIADAVLDCVVERQGLSTEHMEQALADIRGNDWFDIDEFIETDWWRDHMGPAIDAIEDRLSPYLPGDPE